MSDETFGLNLLFNTNARQAQREIDGLTNQINRVTEKSYILSNALRTGNASAKELGFGAMGASKAITKLDHTINNLATNRVQSLKQSLTTTQKLAMQTAGLTDDILRQNEVMRIRRKIVDDTATSIVNLGKNTQWAGRQLVVGFTVPLTIAAGAAGKAFADLEKQMIRFKRVYGDINTGEAELNSMTDAVKELAMEWTRYGAVVSETVQVAADAAGAGFSKDGLIAQVNSATKLAILGEVDRQKAFKATLALQSTFKQSNEELAQSINYLNMLENQTIVTLDDMATAIPKAATIVDGLGGSVKDLGVFLAAMQEGGVSAAEAANALKSGLGSLLNPAPKANKQLLDLGVNLDTIWKNSQNNGGVVYVVEELATALDKLGQVQRQRVVEELFGKHQFARMNALLTNINKGTQAQRAKSVGQTDDLTTALIAQKELDKLGSSTLTKFQSRIERFKASLAPLGESVLAALTPLIEGATKLIDKFNDAPEAFKTLALVGVASLGVIAPVALMLVGQFQNLLGNAMSFSNTLKNLGKNTNWATTETLLMNDAVLQLNNSLLRQNAIVNAGTTGWRSRITTMANNLSTNVGYKKMATGGNVPGSGNSDTVPAMLTPGEFVVKKKMAERFAPLLNAINNGQIRGFAGGGAVDDPGYRAGAGPFAIPTATQKELFGVFANSIDEFVDYLTNHLKLSGKQLEATIAKMKADLAAFEGQGVAGHIVKEVDPIANKKLYKNSNLVAISSIENNTLNLLNTVQQNHQALGLAAQNLAKQENQSAELIASRNQVLGKLIAGEHVVDKAERKLAQELMLEAAQYTMSTHGVEITEKTRANIPLVAAYMNKTPMTYEGEVASTAVADRERSRIGTPTAVYNDTASNVKPRSNIANVGMLMAMFAGQLTGVTEKMGAFGNALTIGITALTMLNMSGVGMGDMFGGVKGRLSGGLSKLGKLKGVGAVASRFRGIGVGGIGGLIGGIGGNLVGGMIDNGQNGTRDVLGRGVAWGATGAGIGAMFGPIGIGVGATVGALAGMVTQINKNNKALRAQELAMRESADSWTDIADELSKKFDLGKGNSINDVLSGVSSLDKKDADLYNTLRESMNETEGPWSNRIKTLVDAEARGRLPENQLLTEIKGLALELRGRGIEEDSIKIIAAAFVSALPEAVRQGLDSSKLMAEQPATISTVLSDINNSMDSLAKTVANTVTTPQGYGLYNTYQPATTTTTMERQFDIPAIAQAGSLLSTALTSSNQILLNAEEGSAEFKQASRDLKAIEASTSSLWAAIKDNEEAQRAFFDSVGGSVRSTITSGKGLGLTEAKWNEMLQDAGENAAELSNAANALLGAGIAIQNMAGAQVSALYGAMQLQATAYKDLGAANAEVTALDKSIADFNNARVERDFRLSSEAGAIRLSKRDVAQEKLAASLEVTRINIEKAALGEFVGKFNNAFNASVDSFADAQYLIDSLGQKISNIQTRLIDPIREKIEKLNRANEMDQRRIEDLDEKRAKWDEKHQKRIDRINKSYDDQADALRRIREQNEFIARQQQASISLADSLASGDLAGAANAMVQSAQNQAQYSMSLQDQELNDRRDAALAAENAKVNPYESKIEAIRQRIDSRTDRIRANEDRIYQINKSLVEPLERRAKAMQSMMSTAKLQMEYQKANAAGVDQENFAREQALTKALLQVEEAKKLRNLEQQINDAFRERARAIAKQHGIQMKNADSLGDALEGAQKRATNEAKRAQKVINQVAKDIVGIKEGSQATIDFYNDKMDPSGLGQTLRDVMDYINAAGENPVTKGKPTSEGKWYGQRTGDWGWNGKEWVRLATGGDVVPGSGGRDTVPAMLTPGEFVMRKSTVDRIGVNNLDAINRGAQFLATGGKVDPLGAFGELAAKQLLANPAIMRKQQQMGEAPAGSASFSPIDMTGDASKLIKVNNAGDRLSLAAMRAMRKAEMLFGRSIRIIQGGYSMRIKASGTSHAGDGTVDTEWLPRAGIIAMRKAGWAAWQRNWPGNRHVHAVQIGNSRASASARGQVQAYARGGDGLGGRDNGPRLPGMPGIDPSTYNKLYRGGRVGYNSGGLVSNHVRTIKTPKYKATHNAERKVVYNNEYNFDFTITEAHDPNQVANYVVRKIERSTQSRVK